MSRLDARATGTKSAQSDERATDQFQDSCGHQAPIAFLFGALIVRLLVALLAFAAPVGAITALALRRFLRRTCLRPLLESFTFTVADLPAFSENFLLPRLRLPAL